MVRLPTNPRLSAKPFLILPIMRRRLALAVHLWFALMGNVLAADAAREIKWADLIPSMEKLDDPFVALTSEQKMDLSIVAVWRQIRARGETLEPAQQHAVSQAQARLAGARVDVDGLLARRLEITEKRRRAAETINAKLDRTRVRILGYALPLEMNGRNVNEFLLVPYVGACIHEPTPPPNQIVHVKYAQGFESSGLYTPVWVEGPIRTVRVESRLSLVDGSANVPTGYSLAAEAVEPLGH